MEKDGDYPFCFGGFLYLYLMYRSPCRQFSEMKEKKDKNGMQGRMKPPCTGCMRLIVSGYIICRFVVIPR